jgi:hypothetical protein
VGGWVTGGRDGDLGFGCHCDGVGADRDRWWDVELGLAHFFFGVWV